MSAAADTLKTLESILQGSAAGPQTFAPNSRYYGLPTLTVTLPDGRTVACVARRFVPPPERFAPLQHHTVAQGERIDNLAFQYFNDPLQYWRICDANRAMYPADLTRTIGTVLRITLPEHMPAPGGGV